MQGIIWLDTFIYLTDITNYFLQIHLLENITHSKVKCMSIFCGLHRLIISTYCYFPHHDSANSLYLEHYFITSLGSLPKWGGGDQFKTEGRYEDS